MAVVLVMISRNQKSIFISLGLLIVTIVFALSLFKPMIMRFKQASLMVQKVNSDREKVMGTVNSIPEMEVERKELEKEMVYLNNRLPKEDKVPEIIRQISEKTSSLDVMVLSVSSGDQMELKDKPVISRMIFIDLISDYSTLARYLKLVEEIETALAIKKVYIARRSTLMAPKLSVKIQVETYISKGQG
ncbi:MAG: type 4a pilus biogenesis protein PilO [Candidatus Aureabacteria bacterium]|nr:type 4a pilus biogenesis protein PilO [Candidatus Auribacterota bacterium]